MTSVSVNLVVSRRSAYQQAMLKMQIKRFLFGIEHIRNLATFPLYWLQRLEQEK